MWLKKFLQNFRQRILARHNRRLEKRRTQNLLRLWRTETRKDKLRLFILLYPLQAVSRFLADSGAEENALTDSNPARQKPSKQIAEKMPSEKNAPAPLRWLRQLPRRCLLRLRHWAARQWSRLCRRCLVKILALLLKLAAWRLSRRP